MAYTVEQLKTAAAGFAHKWGLDPEIFKRLVGQESNWNPNAVSAKGAQGLTQLMPSTAAGLGVRNPFDPMANLDAGARYLRQQLDQFGSYVKGLAAYNWGPGNVQSWNGARGTLPAETRSYLDIILGPDWSGQVTGDPPGPDLDTRTWFQKIQDWILGLGVHAGEGAARNGDAYDIWAPIGLTVAGVWCVGVGVSAAVLQSTPAKIATEVVGAVGGPQARVGAAVVRVAQSGAGDGARSAVRRAGGQIRLVKRQGSGKARP